MESSSARASPPKAEVDESPLHQAKNKESLKVKLMLRRPINQLVAQGIMPPLKTPPGFHEQRQKLERAKMGDLLRAKIQQRPDREELVRQHILEDVGHVDPSLAEKQRQLKKCKLADALNDQLSHRPGPLELIKKNILHTDEPIERAVKEGAIEFKATCEGTATKPTHPDHYMLDEDSSSLSPPPVHTEVSSTTGNEPLTTTTQPQSATTILTLTPQTASQQQLGGSAQSSQSQGQQIVTVLLAPVSLPTAPTATTIYQVSRPSPSPAPPAAVVTSAPQQQQQGPSPQAQLASLGRSHQAARKKSKVKTTPKARTIKFHEYKGPPNAQKNSPSSSSPVETSYELLLQQQQLFLQWQLEWQHKYPQILLPASSKPQQQQQQGGTTAVVGCSSTSSPSSSGSQQGGGGGGLTANSSTTSGGSSASSSASPASSSAASATSEISQSSSAPPPPPPPLPQQSSPSPLRNLEDMKVSDLKAELKRRNLPVSGAKPQLIERLKAFSESHQLSNQHHHTEDSLPSVCSVSSSGAVSSTTPALMETECPESPSSSEPGCLPSPVVTLTTSEPVSTEDIIREQQRKIDLLQRQLTLQLHNNTFQVHQGSAIQPQQQQQPNAKASLAAFLQQQQLNHQLSQQLSQQHQLIIINNNNNILTKQEPKSPPPSSTQQEPEKERSGSLPAFIGTFMNNSNELIPLSNDNFIMDSKLFFETKPLDTNRQQVDELMDVKSEIVDDVLEILIKNGELPASAAAEPLSLEDLDPDLMEVDTDWLDSLALSPPPSNLSSHRTDPLIGEPGSPFDLFMDDADLKMSTDWADRIDFAI